MFDIEDDENQPLLEAREEIEACYSLLADCQTLLNEIATSPPRPISEWMARSARLVRRIEVRLLDPVKGSTLKRRRSA
jgi:hypothetical protein